MKAKSFLTLLLFLISIAFSSWIGATPQESEERDYFSKWLNEDVIYIITDEEREVFQKLSTPEEKERFIEQFWLRRDPVPGIFVNEFQDEHYRRLAYVNERFGSGIPGWKTDRGRVYIKFGPPDEIDSHSGAGTYLRPTREGGGATQTYPFEVWWYRYIDGVGDDMEFEFVDRSWSGEFKLVQAPHEKDMMLYVDGAGPTLGEYLGRNTRLYRPAYQPGLLNSPGFRTQRSKDMPFARMERFFATQRPPEIKFTDLRKVVETRVSYQQLPFALRQDAVRLDEERWLVPLTLALRNQDLGFVQNGEMFQAKVNVYGTITDLTGRVFAEFEDTIRTDLSADEFQSRQKGISIYQRMVALPAGVYKLSLVLKSLNNEKLGTGEARIELPQIPEGKLANGSLILADRLEKLDGLADDLEPFMMGDLKVVPSVTNSFGPHSLVGIYMQVYNASIDQQRLEPELHVAYVILKDDQVVRKIEDLRNNSMVFFSDQRVVLARSMPLLGLKTGRYRMRVVVEDQLTGERVMGEDDFTVVN